MSGDEDWFEQALEDADEETGDTATSDTEDTFDDDSLGDGDGGDPFDDSSFGEAGGASGDDVPAGGEESDPASFSEGGEDLFDDDFTSAFGGSETEFDDEDFESSIPRIDTGIEGLDNMILGGVPARHLIACIGGAGSGKTTFGLQFLHHGLEHGENGVFITLEQSYEDIMTPPTGGAGSSTATNRRTRWRSLTWTPWRWQTVSTTSAASFRSWCGTSTPTGSYSTPSPCWR
jgi:RecA-superfamily ATPases implicated in signal transduction